MFDLYKNILDIIDQATKVKYNVTELYISLEFDSTQIRDNHALQLSDLEIEKNRNCIRISLNQRTFKIFIDISDFNQRIKKQDVTDDNFSKDLLILNRTSKEILLYKYEKIETFRNFELTNANHLFTNTLSYFRLLNFLKSQEHKEDRHFYFVDYFNTDHRRIIITSLKKEGKLTIGYPDAIPDFDINKRLDIKITHFIESFEQKQLPKFLKAELFNVLPSFKKEDRLVAFIDNLEFIQEKAEQNFEIYLSDLTLDAFKNQFLEFRLKYFNQLRDLLSKITTQILALPLSISASAFATYKSIDSILLCSIIVIAFTLFSIYSIFMLKAHRDDVKEINKLFENDYNSFSQNEFFTKYPNELQSFNDTYNYISQRVSFLLRCIDIYGVLLITINSLFVFFVLLQFVSFKAAIILSILLFITLAIIAIVLYFWFKLKLTHTI